MFLHELVEGLALAALGAREELAELVWSLHQSLHLTGTVGEARDSMPKKPRALRPVPGGLLTRP